jgi:Zn-dependent M28 family amino/carboxypeptidase
MNFLPLAFAAAAAAAQPALISAERIREDVRVLASDEFEGRGPGEVGEQKTVEYLSKAFAAAGLEPGGIDGLWTHPVPLVRLDRSPGAELSLTVSGRPEALVVGETVTLALRNPGRTEIANAPLVFGGYGVVDPSLGWDDYAGVDLRGKVVLLLANDPDFEAAEDLGFEGRRMVLSGRVGTKFAAAGRAGALGALVIHEDAAASYPFSQVASGDALPAFVPAPLAPSPLQFSGWLRRDAALQLLGRAGLDLEALKRRARDRSFRAFPLRDAELSASGELRATDFTSHNVIARITGASRPDEYVLYGAHWDANGRNGPDGHGDPIRNGAVDNATGTAEVLDIARAFAGGPRPERTVLFAAWTAEEKGLLGADRYAGNPIYPLERTVAVINLDPHVVLPAARDIELIGGGRTDLEERLSEAAAGLGLRVTPEPNPEAGWYFRSDHFPFARRGVPAIAFRAGRDLVEGGAAAGNAMVEAYNAHDYHQTTDEFDPDWTFTGTALEARVAYELGRALADGDDWPQWYSDVEYRELRAEAPPREAP